MKQVFVVQTIDQWSNVETIVCNSLAIAMTKLIDFFDGESFNIDNTEKDTFSAESTSGFSVHITPANVIEK